MKISPFQAVYPNLDYVASSDAFFGTVKYDYPEYKKIGFFHHSPNKGLYVYQIERENKTYKGIIAGTAIQDLKDGHIKKHENTIAAKEQQQIRLLVSRGAIVKPILLMYPQVVEIDDFLEEYINGHEKFYSTYFESEKARHCIWEVSNEKDIQKFQELFSEKVPSTYIADGHHRTSTSLLMHKRSKQEGNHNFDNMLAALFSVKQLDVHEYNRIIQGFNELSVAGLMVKLSKVFEIEFLKTPEKPQRKHELLMILNEECFKLKWKTKILESYKDESVVLDASLLDDLVMKPILGIEDSRTDERIIYVEGAKGLEGLLKKTKGKPENVAFALFPVDVNDLIKVSDRGEIMPPKSTWFEPRIKNGLIVMEF